MKTSEHVESLRFDLEKKLQEYFPLPDALSPEWALQEACRDSLCTGGKRIRSLLMLLFAEHFELPINQVLPFASALEMIHAYSLIHDDLPAMDDAQTRRGRPACHIAFGEGIAILAGDTLLNSAFEILLEESTSENLRRAAVQIAHAAGINGMIGGQCRDIMWSHEVGEELEQSELIERLNELQRKKTAALIQASIVVPALIAGRPEQEIEQFKVLGENLGLVFQLSDDLLDEAEAEVTNYTTWIGHEAVVAKIEALNEEIQISLIQLMPDDDETSEIFMFINSILRREE